MDYTLVRSRRKTLAVQVDLDGSVTVRAPLRLSQAKIDRFLQEKEAWITRTVETQKQRAAARPVLTDEDRERLRRLAKEVLPRKVEQFAAQMGVRPASVKITSAKTRYGSCSAKNGLCFSLYLMTKPEPCIDYVVVHELAHIRQHNHSAAFYAEIEAVLPDYREREKLLKQS